MSFTVIDRLLNRLIKYGIHYTVTSEYLRNRITFFFLTFL